LGIENLIKKGGEFMDKKTLFDNVKIAIEKELEAYNFYRKVAEGAPDPDTKKLFEELAAVEKEHGNKLEERYKELKDKIDKS